MTPKKLFLILLTLCILGGLVYVLKKETPTLIQDVHIEENTTTYKSEVTVPATGNSALDASVEAYVRAQAQEFADNYAPEMFSEEDLENLGFNDGRQYELLIKGTPWHYKRLSGMSVELYTFTGGAHGSTVYVPFIFDDAGIPVTLPALFVPDVDYLTQLSLAVQEPLRQKLDENQMYIEDMFMEGTSSQENNFFINKIDGRGITFIFQQYQVGPYVVGSPEIVVPFTALADILNPAYFE